MTFICRTNLCTQIDFFEFTCLSYFHFPFRFVAPNFLLLFLLIERNSFGIPNWSKKRVLINLSPPKTLQRLQNMTLRKKWSIPFRISSVNVNKSSVSFGNEETLNGKLHFFVQSGLLVIYQPTVFTFFGCEYILRPFY